MGDKNKLKIGYVGHLYKGKGIEVIQLLLNKCNNDIEFHIVGGTEKDINEWKKNTKY